MWSVVLVNAVHARLMSLYVLASRVELRLERDTVLLLKHALVRASAEPMHHGPLCEMQWALVLLPSRVVVDRLAQLVRLA